MKPSINKYGTIKPIHAGHIRLTFLWVSVILCCQLPAQPSRPNFIIILTDDQGYQDLGCYGSPDIRTPHLDKMAKEGMKFTSFYAQTVCGPSRAALMTGCYPSRLARNDVGDFPHPKIALSEITIAELLRPAGYATCMIGKWDMAGHNPEQFNSDLLPIHQGFNYSFLTPASNDTRVHLIRDTMLIKRNADMSTLTRRYTDEAITFIEQHADDPFFIYLAHTMPHTKLAVSEEFKGKSKGGLYGDVIEEIDYHVGRIMAALQKKGLDENTYVIFTSDNGPWWLKGDHGGHAKPLRGAKTSTWEGGFRVPCIVRAPGKVPADMSTDLVAATIDMLPTIAKLAGVETPTDRVIDGMDLSPIIHGDRKELARPFYYYKHQELRAVRLGEWKLFLAHPDTGRTAFDKSWLRHIAPEDRVIFEDHTLFNLNDDIGETTNVANAHPDIVLELLELAAWARKDIGDYGHRGNNARAVGNEPYNTPNDIVPVK